MSDPGAKYEMQKSSSSSSNSLVGETISIDDLPALPLRDSKYWKEPVCIVVIVMCISLTLGWLTSNMAMTIREGIISILLHVVIWLWAAIAICCTLYLLFGKHPDEIKRTSESCFPIPNEVLARLSKYPSNNLVGFGNLQGPSGSTTHGSYCVRCFFWRPPTQSHHCRICNRCVTGFDHHCGVIGRCITRHNMPCFITLISMFPIGVITAVAALVVAGLTTKPELDSFMAGNSTIVP